NGMRGCSRKSRQTQSQLKESSRPRSIGNWMPRASVLDRGQGRSIARFDMIGKLRLYLEKPALRQGSLVLLDQGFVSLATFLTGAMLARATEKGEYSAYVLAASL